MPLRGEFACLPRAAPRSHPVRRRAKPGGLHARPDGGLRRSTRQAASRAPASGPSGDVDVARPSRFLPPAPTPPRSRPSGSCRAADGGRRARVFRGTGACGCPIREPGDRVRSRVVSRDTAGFFRVPATASTSASGCSPAIQRPSPAGILARLQHALRPRGGDLPGRRRSGRAVPRRADAHRPDRRPVRPSRTARRRRGGGDDLRGHRRRHRQGDGERHHGGLAGAECVAGRRSFDTLARRVRDEFRASSRSATRRTRWLSRGHRTRRFSASWRPRERADDSHARSSRPSSRNAASAAVVLRAGICSRRSSADVSTVEDGSSKIGSVYRCQRRTESTDRVNSKPERLCHRPGARAARSGSRRRPSPRARAARAAPALARTTADRSPHPARVASSAFVTGFGAVRFTRSLQAAPRDRPLDHRDPVVEVNPRHGTAGPIRSVLPRRTRRAGRAAAARLPPGPARRRFEAGRRASTRAASTAARLPCATERRRGSQSRAASVLGERIVAASAVETDGRPADEDRRTRRRDDRCTRAPVASRRLSRQNGLAGGRPSASGDRFAGEIDDDVGVADSVRPRLPRWSRGIPCEVVRLRAAVASGPTRHGPSRERRPDERPSEETASAGDDRSRMRRSDVRTSSACRALRLAYAAGDLTGGA